MFSEKGRKRLKGAAQSISRIISQTKFKAKASLSHDIRIF